MPVKFITGNLDLLYSLETTQDYIFNGGFKQDVPSLEEVKVLPGVGHFSIAAEAADRVNTEIYNFIHKFPN